MKRSIFTIAALLALTLLLTPAFATTLAPGTSISAPTPLGSNPFPALGTAIATIAGPWSYPSPPDPTPGSGSYKESVYRDGSGHLVFAFQVYNSGPDIVETLTSAKWSGVGHIDAEQWAGGTSGWAAGATAGKAAKIGLHGGVVKWDMNPDIGSGKYSYVLLLYTDATKFVSGSFTVQDGGTSTNPAYVPAPEPATLSLLGFGIAGLGLFRKQFLK